MPQAYRAALPRPPRLITFDVYSALFDHASTLHAALIREFGSSLDAVAMAKSWRTDQLAMAQASNVLGSGRITFRQATRLALERALHRFGLACTPGAQQRLLQSWDELAPWPDVCEGLKRLQAMDIPLALLSNGDADMLDALATRLPVAFDHILSSSEADAFKPHPAMYLLAVTASGVEAEHVLHVAGSSMDVLGTRDAGLCSAWINRANEPPLDPARDAHLVVPHLNALVDALC